MSKIWICSQQANENIIGSNYDKEFNLLIRRVELIKVQVLFFFELNSFQFLIYLNNLSSMRDPLHSK